MTYTKEMIVAMLKTNNFAVERAILALYALQTQSEQNADMTEERNGVGFGAFDAEIFSSFARQIAANKYNNPNGQRLSAKQFAIARKESKSGTMKIARYAGQLVKIANSK
jgi:hypothetical protein